MTRISMDKVSVWCVCVCVLVFFVFKAYYETKRQKNVLKNTTKEISINFCNVYKVL